MNEAAIREYISTTFFGVEQTTALGYTFFFCGSARKLSFATLASSDNEHDRVSNLDRPGVFRVNMGISKLTFQSLFGADKVDLTGYDFTALDMIMPHPHYAAQHFVCVLSPGEGTSERVRTLLSEAYQLAKNRDDERAKSERRERLTGSQGQATLFSLGFRYEHK